MSMRSQAKMEYLKRTALRENAAFTMIEAVIAIALFAMILFAAGQILYTMIQALAVVETEPKKLNHADSVTSFLEQAFLQSTDRQEGRTEKPEWKVPPGMNTEVLYFEVSGGHPLFVSETWPLPKVQAYLVLPKEGGLELYWSLDPQAVQQNQGRRRRAVSQTSAVVRTQISPFVEDMEYHYSRGEEESEFVSARESEAVRKGDWKLEGLRLTFNVNGSLMERYIRLDYRLGKVLLY